MIRRLFIPTIFICVTIVGIGCQKEAPQMTKPFIAVNLVGYDTGDVKQALLVNAAAEYYEIVDSASTEVVFQGPVGASLPADIATGDSTMVIDFSDFDQEGRYYIRAMGVQDIRSRPFSISKNIYKSVAQQAVQSYYYARCGTTVDNGKPWRHSICHLGDGIFYSDPSTFWNTTGGWHDAGDYNKYSINTELSAALLLYLHEVRPTILGDGTLNIPESGNGIPDLLDEVRWALKWLMKMQDTTTGGIYHKVSQKKWVGEFLPHKDPETRYIFEVSSNATGGFAATAALAARIFEPYDQDFADKLRDSALTAWQYLKNHPEIQPAGGFKNPPDVSGGEYGDSYDMDVRLWAAMELYRLTEDQKFLDFFIDHYPSIDIYNTQPLSWKDFTTLAFSSFLDARVPAEYATHQVEMLQNLKSFTATRMVNYEQSSYRTMLSHKEYYWGSNSVALGYAYLLTTLYRHTGDSQYYQAAMDQLHYNLGRNALGQSYVTGVGTNHVKHPYHQLSMELEYDRAVPGMLVGGPNNYVLLNDVPLSKYAAKSYEDSEANYYVNEVAINWTAILAYTAGFFTTADEIISTN